MFIIIIFPFFPFFTYFLPYFLLNVVSSPAFLWQAVCLSYFFLRKHYSSSFLDLETNKYSPVILVFHPALFVPFFGATFKMPMFFSGRLPFQVNKQRALTCCYCLTGGWRGMNEGTRTDLNSRSMRPNNVVVTAMNFILPMMIKGRIMLVIMNNRRDSCQRSIPFVHGSCVCCRRWSCIEGRLRLTLDDWTTLTNLPDGCTDIIGGWSGQVMMHESWTDLKEAQENSSLASTV